MPDLARSFTYMFEDKNWLSKALVGAAFVLLSWFIIGIPFLLGYSIMLVRRSYEDNEVPLPEWENFGDLFTKGLILFVIGIILAIPAVILHFFPCGELLAMLYSLLVALVYPLIVGRYAITNDLNAVFQINEIIDMLRENIATLAAILIMQIIFWIIAMMGILALFIGILFTTFYAMLAVSYLYGKAYQEAVKKAESANIGGGSGDATA